MYINHDVLCHIILRPDSNDFVKFLSLNRKIRGTLLKLYSDEYVQFLIEKPISGCTVIIRSHPTMHDKYGQAMSVFCDIEIGRKKFSITIIKSYDKSYILNQVLQGYLDFFLKTCKFTPVMKEIITKYMQIHSNDIIVKKLVSRLKSSEYIFYPGPYPSGN